MNMATVDELIQQTRHLSLLDKTRLIQKLAAIVQDDLARTDVKAVSRSLAGLWSGISLSAEDIDSARQELWRDFPRSDV